MTKLPRFLAALLVALFASLAFAPARATSLPVGAALAVGSGSLNSHAVQYRHYRQDYDHTRHDGRSYYNHRRHHWRPVHRPRYYGGSYFYSYPVYRHCVNRPRWVWTHHGYVRRWVRVCH